MPDFHDFVKEQNISFEFDTIQDHHELFITHLKGEQPFHITHRRNAVTLNDIGEGVKDYIESVRQSRATSVMDAVGLGVTDILDDFEEDVDDAIEKANDFADTKDKQGQSVGELVRAIGMQQKFGAVGKRQIIKTLKQASKLIEHAQENELNHSKIEEAFDSHEKLTEHVLVRVLKALKNGVKDIVSWVKDLFSSIFSSVQSVFGKIYEFITANRGRVLAVIALAIWVGYRIYTDSSELLTALLSDVSSLTNYLMGLFKSVWDGSSVESWFIWLKDTAVNEYYLLTSLVPGEYGKYAMKKYTLSAAEKVLVLAKTAQHIAPWAFVGGKAAVGSASAAATAGGFGSIYAAFAAGASAVVLTPAAVGMSVVGGLYTASTFTSFKQEYMMDAAKFHLFIINTVGLLAPIVWAYFKRKFNIRDGSKIDAAMSMGGTVIQGVTGLMMISAGMKKAYIQLLRESVDEGMGIWGNKMGYPEFRQVLIKNRGNYLKRITERSLEGIVRLNETRTSLLSVYNDSQETEENRRRAKELSDITESNIKDIEDRMKINEEGIKLGIDNSLEELQDIIKKTPLKTAIEDGIQRIQKMQTENKLSKKDLKILRGTSKNRTKEIEAFLASRRTVPLRRQSVAFKLRF